MIRARFDAAQTTAENARHWAMADCLSADAAGSSDVRKRLRERSRYEVANNSYAKGIALTLANDCVGIDPRPLTLRQLVWMAEGMGREHWSHTAAICATIANTCRAANRRAYTPDDFNPYAVRSRRSTGAIEVTPETLPKFREAFVGPKGG